MLAPLSRLICHVIAPLVPAEGCPAFLCYYCWFCSWPRTTVLRWARASWLGLSALVVLPRLRHRSRLTPRPVTGPRAPLCTTVTAEATEATASKSRWAMCTALHTINTGFFCCVFTSLFFFRKSKSEIRKSLWWCLLHIGAKISQPETIFCSVFTSFFFWWSYFEIENLCWTHFLKFSIC